MASIKSARTWSIIVLFVALLLLAGVAYAIAGSRAGLVAYPTAFDSLRWIGRAGAVVAVLGLVTFVWSLGRKPGGTAYAGIATVLMAAMVGLMYVYQVGPPPQPFMNDITTDLEDPPEFDAILPLRADAPVAAAYGGAEVAANQRRAHPEIEPIISTLAPDDAFDRALEVADGLGWEIVAQDRRTGIVEAVDTTPFFRFKDDIVIRVRPHAQGSRIDLRSHSRIGLTDLGKNAARIMEFVRAYPMRG